MHRPQTPRGAAAVLAAAALVLAACSGSDDGATSTGDGAVRTAAGEASVDAPAGRSTGGGFDRDVAVEAPDGEPPSGVPVADQAAREVIRTAAITLELDDPEAAFDEIATVAEDEGGFVASADLRRDDGTGEIGGNVTVRVPSGALLATLGRLEALAVAVPERLIDAADVTGEAVDLRAQAANLTAYETELRALLGDIREATADPDQLLPVFDRTQSVRSDIDRITAQLDDLEDRVALSTITVTLRPAAGSEPIVTGSFTPGRTFDAAMAATGRALGTVADAAIWTLVTVVPVAVVLLGPPVAIAWTWRRLRRGATAGTDASTSPG